MKILWVSLVLAFGWSVQAVTYYVRADGSATKVNAVGPTSDATKCMSAATYKASTYLAGDTIYFSDQGGAYTVQITIPSSGSAGSSIRYMNAPGEYPLIANTVSVNSFVETAKSYILMSGMTVSNTTSGFQAIQLSGAGNDIVVSNCTTISNTYGMYAAGGYSNLTIVGGINIGNGTYNFRVVNAQTNVIIVGCSNALGASLNIANVNGISISNTVITNNAIQISSCSGLLSMNNVSALSPGSSAGCNINNNTWSGGGITNVSSSGSSSEGLRLVGATNLYVVNCTNILNTGGGFTFFWCTNITVSNCLSLTNAGKAFYCSSNSTQLTFNNCYALSNIVTGIGFQADNAASYLSYTNCLADHLAWGWYNIGGAHHITIVGCVGSYNLDLAFNDADATPGDVHDITYIRCEAHHSGNKTTTANNTGFGVHFNAYNEALINCSSHDNTGGGFSFGNTSSGYATGCVFSNNAANWSLFGGGGVDQNRGGLYCFQTGTNTIAGPGSGWTITNCVVVRNYPRDVYGPLPVYDIIDRNYYCPISNQFFWSDNGGSTTKDWWTYHGTNEPHSMLFSTPNMVRLGGRMIP